MEIEAEQNYFDLYASVFNKFKPKEIKKKLDKIASRFSGESDEEKTSDIIDDRKKLKQILKNQRPLL